MTTSKNTIKTILEKLDITDDQNWTEDGAPALEVVQKLANDDTISRGQINDALPGFVRQVGDNKNDAATPAENKNTTIQADPTADVTARRYTDDEMREILDRRINDAEENLLLARKAQSEATQEVVRCEARLQRAHVDHGRQFPPVTAAANIKSHLDAQIRQARLRAGLEPEVPVASLRPQIDLTMEQSNRRGSGKTRPTRPVNNISTAA